ncbi:MAG: GNAT family N-acetyltransferase [Rhizobiaceae bacterium]
MTPNRTMQSIAARQPRQLPRGGAVRKRGNTASPDDAEVVYRKLKPADGAAIADHLKRLPSQDRRLRFMGYVGDAVIDRYCAGLDWQRAVLIGAFVDGVLRGVAHVALGEKPGGEAEIGLSVEPAHQGKRIGTELFDRALLSARNRSAVSVRVNCLAENHKMRRIAGKYSKEAGHCGDELTLLVHQDASDAVSHVQEAKADGIASTRIILDHSKWTTHVQTAP